MDLLQFCYKHVAMPVKGAITAISGITTLTIFKLKLVKKNLGKR